MHKILITILKQNIWYFQAKWYFLLKKKLEVLNINIDFKDLAKELVMIKGRTTLYFFLKKLLY